MIFAEKSKILVGYRSEN